MQRLSLQLKRTFLRSINFIPKYGMSNGCHMNSDLMCPAGLKLTLNKGILTSKTLQNPVMCDGMYRKTKA